MSKLNIDCLLKLIDQLTHDDYIKLKELLQDKTYIMKDKLKPETYLIKANNEDDFLIKIFKMGLPKHCSSGYRCVNYKDHNNQNWINILMGDLCFMCNSSSCDDHKIKGICCLSRSELTLDDFKKIINNMINHVTIECLVDDGLGNECYKEMRLFKFN
jgi:hypothetical protein